MDIKQAFEIKSFRGLRYTFIKDVNAANSIVLGNVKDKRMICLKDWDWIFIKEVVSDGDNFRNWILKSTVGKVNSLWKVKSKNEVFYTFCFGYQMFYFSSYRSYTYFHIVFKDENAFMKFMLQNS